MVLVGKEVILTRKIKGENILEKLQHGQFSPEELQATRLTPVLPGMLGTHIINAEYSTMNFLALDHGAKRRCTLHIHPGPLLVHSMQEAET